MSETNQHTQLRQVKIEAKHSKSEVADFFKSVYPPKTAKEAGFKDYKFWDTQPVPKIVSDVIQKEGQIEQLEQVSEDEVYLPEIYEWKEINVHSVSPEDKDDTTRLLKFLNRCYIEDPNSSFLEVFTEDRLKYMLGPAEFCIGVVSKNKPVLAGFISGRIQKTQLKKDQVDVLEVTCLCVHPRLRRKRLTVQLISELKRRALIKNCNQGIFCTERYIPKPFTTTDLYHRPLNIEKLVDVGFTTMTGKVQLEELKNKFRLPKKTTNKNIVMLNDQSIKYVSQACDLLNKYLSKYIIHPIFTKEEFIKRFMGDNNSQVVSYVLINKDNSDKVEDFVSYYTYNLKTRNKEKADNFEEKSITVGHLYYYTSTCETAYRLVNDALILAKNVGIDLFNATTIMENNTLLRELQFEEGPTKFHNNLFNWNLSDVDPSQIGFNF